METSGIFAFFGDNWLLDFLFSSFPEWYVNLFNLVSGIDSKSCNMRIEVSLIFHRQCIYMTSSTCMVHYPARATLDYLITSWKYCTWTKSCGFVSFFGQRLFLNAQKNCTGALSSTLQTTFTLQVHCQRARARPIVARCLEGGCNEINEGIQDSWLWGCCLWEEHGRALSMYVVDH